MRYLTQNDERIVREWMLDEDRIRLSIEKYTPTEQDIQCVLDILDWPEYRDAVDLHVSASVVLWDLLMLLFLLGAHS